MKQPVPADIWPWVADLAEAEDLAACAARFRTIVRLFRVDGFANGEVDLDHRERSVFYVVDWPESWRKFYMGGMIERDPLINMLRRRRAPFTWSELLADEDFDVADRQVLKLAVDAGWTEGLVVTIPRAEGRFGLISLLRRRDAFTPHEKALLALLSVYFHERVRALITTKAFAVPPAGLAARATECLQLAAAGHSDKVIAGKLGISHMTVHEYVENAKLKLSARTRTEAVAVALSLGIIRR